MRKLFRLFTLFSSILLLSCTKKDNGSQNPSAPLPSVKVGNITVNRQNTNSTCRFYVDISAAFSKPVTVNYSTVSGTAVADSDFIPLSGVLTFQPGVTELYVDVIIIGDSLRRDPQTFYLQLSDPKNCTLGNASATASITNDGTYLPTDTSGFETPLTYPGYHLVWDDEFNGSQLNPNDWNYETGTGGNGWGNNELEYYTSRPQNIFLSDGNLVIEARKESYNGSQYTSARITTQGKEQFTYGRIDIRAKLPVQTGMWPALWMLGSNISTVGWPQCGETDIMELIGKNSHQVVGSFHWKNSSGTESTFNNTYTLPSGDFSQQFHVYSLIWSKDSLQILVDDIPFVNASRADLTNGTYPFDSPFFFIFNVAVGGNWPGPPDNTTQFPQRMFVDYVRVFQKN